MAQRAQRIPLQDQGHQGPHLPVGWIRCAFATAPAHRHRQHVSIVRRHTLPRRHSKEMPEGGGVLPWCRFSSFVVRRAGGVERLPAVGHAVGRSVQKVAVLVLASPERPADGSANGVREEPRPARPTACRRGVGVVLLAGTLARRGGTSTGTRPVVPSYLKCFGFGFGGGVRSRSRSRTGPRE